MNLYAQQLADATGRVIKKAQTEAYPSLSFDEVSEIVARRRRADQWAAGKAFALGDHVQIYQDFANSHGWPQEIPAAGVYFECRQAGVTGAAPPAWFGGAAFVTSPAGLFDGTVLWVYVGIAYPDFFDIGGAVYDAWMEKAAKAAGDFDVSSNQQSVKRSQIYDHCVAMANKYAPLFLA